MNEWVDVQIDDGWIDGCPCQSSQDSWLQTTNPN